MCAKKDTHNQSNYVNVCKKRLKEIHIIIFIMEHQTPFYCQLCEYNTNKKSRYNAHLLTKKHYMKVNDINPTLCVQCNITYSDKYSYLRHLSTIHAIDVSQFKYKEYYLIELHNQIKHSQKNKYGKLRINYLVDD